MAEPVLAWNCDTHMARTANGERPMTDAEIISMQGRLIEVMQRTARSTRRTMLVISACLLVMTMVQVLRHGLFS